MLAKNAGELGGGDTGNASLPLTLLQLWGRGGEGAAGGATRLWVFLPTLGTGHSSARRQRVLCTQFGPLRMACEGDWGPVIPWSLYTCGLLSRQHLGVPWEGVSQADGVRPIPPPPACHVGPFQRGGPLAQSTGYPEPLSVQSTPPSQHQHFGVLPTHAHGWAGQLLDVPLGPCTSGQVHTYMPFWQYPGMGCGSGCEQHPPQQNSGGRTGYCMFGGALG